MTETPVEILDHMTITTRNGDDVVEYVAVKRIGEFSDEIIFADERLIERNEVCDIEDCFFEEDDVCDECFDCHCDNSDEEMLMDYDIENEIDLAEGRMIQLEEEVDELMLEADRLSKHIHKLRLSQEGDCGGSEVSQDA